MCVGLEAHILRPQRTRMAVAWRAEAALIALLIFGAASAANAKLPSVPSNVNLLQEVLSRLAGSQKPQADPAVEALLRNVTAATRAFLWAFPLVNTAPNMVNNGVTHPSDMNSFLWAPTPNNATFNSIVSPNVNVLYGPGFFDLTKGPVTITVPDTAGRYYVLQCMDYWGLTFARIGFSVTGTGPGTYTLVGPGYNSSLLQPGVFQSGTFGVWVLGRVAVINRNASDIAIADALLPQFKVTAPRLHSSPIYSSTTTAARLWDKFLHNNKAESFWHAYDALLPYNPPSPRQRLDLPGFRDLGLTDSGIDYSKLSSDQKALLGLGAGIGWQLLQLSSTTNVTSNSSSVLLTSTGWKTSPTIGSANNTVLAAAVISEAYVAGNVPAEAVYWTTYTDSCGKALAVGKNYLFKLDTRPPFRAFWSLTTYNTTNYLLIPTTNDTYTLGSQFPGLQLNPEGGATLYLSQRPPSDPALLGNWLPLGLASTPGNEGFYLIFRIYSPTSDDVVYTYAPPYVRAADSSYEPLPC